MDSVAVRVDRMERELEYLENKIPTQTDIEMEEALLEQQIKAAEQEQLKKKAKIKVEKGRKGACTRYSMCGGGTDNDDRDYVLEDQSEERGGGGKE